MVVSRHLPLEIVSTILRALDAQGEGGRDALCSCSLACAAWRHRCLPLLFRELDIVIGTSSKKTLLVNDDQDMQIRGCYELLEKSPHIRPHVRRLALTQRQRQNQRSSDGDCDVDAPRFSAILRMLPNLHELFCDFAPTTSLRKTLVPVAFTLATKPRMGKLHLKGSKHDPEALLRVLAEVAWTVREVTLEEVGAESDSGDADSWNEEEESDDGEDGDKDDSREDSDFVPVDTTDGPICMFTLEKLVVISCDDLPFDSESVHMPSLKTLSCTYEELPQLRDCMPDACALHTLVLSEIPEVQYEEYVFDPFSVENLCVRWCHRGYPSRGRTIEYALNEYIRLSNAKHLEVVVPLSLPEDLLHLMHLGDDQAGTDANDDNDDRECDGDGGYGVQAMADDLEASILNGYRPQPFEQVTITVTFAADSGDGDKTRYVDIDGDIDGAEVGDGDGNGWKKDGWKENEKDRWKDEEKGKAWVSKKFEGRFVVLRRLVKLDIRVGMPPVMHL